MAVYFADNPPNGDIVPAVAQRVIRVRRIIFTTDQNGSFELRHSFGTGEEARILPKIYVRAAGMSPLDLRFREEAPQTPAGTPLGFYTDLVGSFSLWVEYEIVA